LFIGGNPIYIICRLFKTTKQFVELFKDYNFIYNDKIIKSRFEQACIDAGITMPKTIKDYDISRLSALISRQSMKPAWKDYADDNWFKIMETKAEQLLASFFRAKGID